MKILVFGHVPPPAHGQSTMVKAMLDGLNADARWSCFHVDSRVSSSLADVGHIRAGKSLSILRYCLKAIWLRLRHGVRTFYYVPAPPKRAPLYRDWIVLGLCRPFFPSLILHWHSVGLAAWLDTSAMAWERKLTYFLLRRPDLSIAVAQASSADALAFESRRVTVVPNGIADLHPDYDATLSFQRESQRQRRLALLNSHPHSAPSAAPIRMLFLTHCSAQKGLFRTLDLLEKTNRLLAAQGSNAVLELTVAGLFPAAAERREFERRLLSEELRGRVRYAGFAGGVEKQRLFEEADLFCFLPDPAQTESFGLVLVEAMAAGLPIIASAVHAIPEILGESYPGLVNSEAPSSHAGVLLKILGEKLAPSLRERFLQRFTLERCIEELASALEASMAQAAKRQGAD